MGSYADVLIDADAGCESAGQTIRCDKKNLLEADGTELKGDRRPKHRGRGRGASPGPGVSYLEADGCCWMSADEGEEPVKLADFTARIAEKISRHGAGNDAIFYKIKSTHSDPSIGHREVVVGSREFREMAWVHDLGPEFRIEAGQGIRDHFRSAIQFLSVGAGPIRRVEEFGAIGPIELDGRRVHLHAGGAIGAGGHRGRDPRHPGRPAAVLHAPGPARCRGPAGGVPSPPRHLATGDRGPIRGPGRRRHRRHGAPSSSGPSIS